MMSNQSNGPVFDVRRDSASLYDDSAFDSHSGFMFEEAGADEEFCSIQRTISSLNILTDGQQNYNTSIGEGHGHDGISGMSEQDNPDFVTPFIFSQGDLSPQSPPWPSELPNGLPSVGLSSHSMQAEIANGRSVSVSHQFGQITPPGDEAPRSISTVAPHLTEASPQAQTMLSAKSERARNAANQRHAKAKKARKDTARKDSQDMEDDGGDEDRRERYREKNRLAAAKCRAKKKMNTEDLEESARHASATNNKLRAEERELRDLFSTLRGQALAHDPSQGCGCQAIHSYNLHKAQETARGAMGGLHGLIIPSPSQRSIDSSSPSTVGASSKAGSFPGLRPRSAEHPRLSHSLADPLRYMPGSDILQQTSSAGGDMSYSCYEFTQSPTDGDGENFPQYLQGSSEG